MDLSEFGNLNWLAIAIGAIVTFLLGGAWYTALFGKTWVKLHGYSDEQLKAMQTSRPPALFFTGLIICYFIIAIALALLVRATDAHTAAEGLHAGLHVWLIVAAVGMTGHLASNRHIGVYLIDVSYQLLYILGLGMLFAAWQ